MLQCSSNDGDGCIAVYCVALQVELIVTSHQLDYIPDFQSSRAYDQALAKFPPTTRPSRLFDHFQLRLQLQFIIKHKILSILD